MKSKKMKSSESKNDNFNITLPKSSSHNKCEGNKQL